jgi:hypothetical protein
VFRVVGDTFSLVKDLDRVEHAMSSSRMYSLRCGMSPFFALSVGVVQKILAHATIAFALIPDTRTALDGTGNLSGRYL